MTRLRNTLKKIGKTQVSEFSCFREVVRISSVFCHICLIDDEGTQSMRPLLSSDDFI